MVYTRPPTSKSSSPFNSPLVSVANWYDCHLHVPQFFFNSLARSRYLSFFSLSFSFILWSTGTAKSTILQVLFVDNYKAWSSGQDQVIRVYVKVPYEFMCIIFQDRPWVAHLPFFRMVKCKFLAHLLVDHFADLVVFSLIFLLR